MVGTRHPGDAIVLIRSVGDREAGLGPMTVSGVTRKTVRDPRPPLR
jgi:hypothetical protein